MSYSLSAYLVKLQEIRDVVGSKNRDLLGQLSAAQAEEIVDFNRTFEGEIEAGGPSMERALADLVEGVSLDKKAESQYWCAVQLIARHLGREAIVPALEDINYAYLQEVDDLLGQTPGIPAELRLTALLGRMPPLPLPGPPEWPTVGFLAVDECSQVARTLEGVAPDDLDGDQDILRGVQDYANMIDEAIANTTDVLLFYY